MTWDWWRWSGAQGKGLVSWGPRLILIACVLAWPALAQDYPNRPVRWLLGFAPGGPNDVLARLLGQYLSEKLGQPFVIESRPGAGGNLATQAVATAPPDGHTLLGIGHFNAINATLYKQLPFDFMRDIVPVAGIAQAPNILMVHPSIPARTVAELIAYLKANPDKVSFPSSGNGTSSHLAAELFKAMTGTSMQHVPYRGTGAVWPDLLTGQVQVYFTSPVGSLQYVQEGKLRALAVTTATRSDVLPGVPTVAETVPGFEVTTWFGIGAPKATPAAIVARLNREINAGLNDPTIKARLGDLGGTPFIATPAEMAAHVAAETERWGKAVKFSGATVD
jgi:tripartite-type tricarboxylate transporter receptor subunit TctC